MMHIDMCSQVFQECANINLHYLSNGGCAMLDVNDRLIAYNKNGKPDGNNWDWVRKNYRLKD